MKAASLHSVLKAVVALTCLAMPSMNATAQEDSSEDSGETASFHVLGYVSVGADGAVVESELDDISGYEELRTALEQYMDGWTFEPLGSVAEDEPVWFRITLELNASRLEGRRSRYLVGVSNIYSSAITGPPTPLTRQSPPNYPMRALNQGLEARVRTIFRFDDDGRITDIHFREVTLRGRGVMRMSEERVARVAGFFEREVERAMAYWRAGQDRTATGHRQGSITIEFHHPDSRETLRDREWPEQPRVNRGLPQWWDPRKAGFAYDSIPDLVPTFDFADSWEGVTVTIRTTPGSNLPPMGDVSVLRSIGRMNDMVRRRSRQ